MKELKNQGPQIVIHKVRRRMRELALKARATRRYKIHTDNRHSFPVAANVINCQFDVDQSNRCRTADITDVRNLQWWMYLDIVMDL